MLPAAVLVKIHDPCVGRIYSIPVPGCDCKAVEISPISARFFAQQGVTLQRNQLQCTFVTLLGCHHSQGTRSITGCSSDRFI